MFFLFSSIFFSQCNKHNSAYEYASITLVYTLIVYSFIWMHYSHSKCYKSPLTQRLTLQRPQAVKAQVCSLFLVSYGKKSITNFQHIVIKVVWKNTRLLHLSLALYYFDRAFLTNYGSFQRAHVPVGCSRLCSLTKATSWLAVETSDVPHILKLASDYLTS